MSEEIARIDTLEKGFYVESIYKVMSLNSENEALL
jgi:hypothetical protein